MVHTVFIGETTVTGHKYVTVAVDHTSSSVFFVAEGKENTAVDRRVKEIESKNGRCKNIKTLTSDMSLEF